MDLRAVATDAVSAEELCDRIAATGALDEARAMALEHVATAKERLDRLGLPSGCVQALRLVADGVVERYA